MDICNGIKELFNSIAKKDAGKKAAVFLKGFEIAEAGILINEGVLVKLLTNGISDKASRRNKLDVDPPVRSGTGHLRIGLGIILGIRQLRGL